MGQMGNSEDATMPDDLPFEMADLIVVGGQGEPMEFARGWVCTTDADTTDSTCTYNGWWYIYWYADTYCI